MGNLKDDLKTAAGLLKAGDNKKVIELLNDYAHDESADYRVLCFIALAYSNTSDYKNSYQMYKKAVEIDEANLMAWKGLFKLFEVESSTTPDQFSLRVCEFMQKNGDDKKEQAAQARRRIHVEMKMWTEILSSFDELKFNKDVENLRRIVEHLSSQKEYEMHKELLGKTFKALEEMNMLENDAKTMLLLCKFTKSTDSVLRLVKMHKDMVSDDMVQKKLFEYSCQTFFESKTFPDVVNYVTCASSSTMDVLTALKENDVSSALDALEAISDCSAYPDCFLFVGLLAETENWEAVEKLNRSIYQLHPSTVCNGWISRALLEIDSESTEKLQALGSLPLPEFAIEELKISILSANDVHINKLLQQYDASSKLGIMLRLIKVLFSNDAVTSEHVELADQLPMETSQELVLAAEIRIRAGLDANNLLVKAAKLNVRCSRAFFLLGNVISIKNLTKAKSLIERAIQIRPGNEEYAQSMNSLLVKRGASPEDRLKVLNTLLMKKRSRQKPFWLADALSIIYMELGNLTEAIDELQQMVRLYKDNKSVWARLADAYTRKGHLRAAVSSYAQLAEMEDCHEFTIPVTRVLLQLREFDEALEKVTELRENIAEQGLECSTESSIVLDFTEAELRLNLHETNCGEQKIIHLKEALRLLARCIDEEGSCQFSTVFKLLGDALLVVAKYAERMLPSFEIEKTWQIRTPLDCVSKAASFYMAVLRSQNLNALAWYDVSVALLSKFKLDKDPEILPKVQRMLEHALSFTTAETLLSSIWTLLSEAKRLADQPIRHQLHCLSRALQLNKANDAAWLKVAVLCLEMGMMNEASRVLEQTIKYNPHNAEAWCTWAQTAHLQGDAHEAQAMFRQALFVRPVPSAIVGYSTYLCDSLKKTHVRFDSATAALDFEAIIDLKNLATADDNILYHLGLLADLFGWYPESLECFQLSKHQKLQDEEENAQIKTSILYPAASNQSLPTPYSVSNSRVGGMLRLNSADSYAFLTAEMDVYRDLYQFIENNDAAAFRKLYVGCVKGISVPLFISGLIIKKINLSIEFIRTMHDALPRHELIDYFPTVLPEGMDNGLRHLEQDGEEPFRYRHRSAHRLLDELKRLREQVEEENAKIEIPMENEDATNSQLS